jgi:hypothetical protein
MLSEQDNGRWHELRIELNTIMRRIMMMIGDVSDGLLDKGTMN